MVDGVRGLRIVGVTTRVAVKSNRPALTIIACRQANILGAERRERDPPPPPPPLIESLSLPTRWTALVDDDT